MPPSGFEDFDLGELRRAHWVKPEMPEKLIGPAEPPVTLSADQSQVPDGNGEM